MKINELDKSNLAIRTRGLDWDYDFVVRPKSCEDLYGIHTALFKDATPEATPQNRFIERPLPDEKSSMYAIGTCFLIEKNRDEFNRIIRYYIIYILPKEDKNIGEFIVLKNWGEKILKHLDLYATLSSSTKENIEHRLENLSGKLQIDENKVTPTITIKNKIIENTITTRTSIKPPPKKTLPILRIGCVTLLIIGIIVLIKKFYF